MQTEGGRSIRGRAINLEASSIKDFIQNCLGKVLRIALTNTKVG